MGMPDETGWFYLQEENSAWVRRFLRLRRGFLYAHATEDPESEVICSLKLTDSLIDYCSGDGSSDGSALLVVTISPICHIVYQNPRRSTSISAETDSELRSLYQAVRRMLGKEATSAKDQRPLMPVQRALLKSQTATVGAAKNTATLRQLFSEPLPPPPQQQSWQGLDACESRKEINILLSLKTSAAAPSSTPAHAASAKPEIMYPSAPSLAKAGRAAVVTDSLSHERGRRETRSALTVTRGTRGLGSTDESAAITVKLQEKARVAQLAVPVPERIGRMRSVAGRSARSSGLAAAAGKRGASQPRHGIPGQMRTVH
jgi:hypothetical protein